MAEALRLGIFVASLVLAGFAFYTLRGTSAALVSLAVALAGGVVAERVFNRLATAEDKRRDLEGRTRNPPS